MTTITYHAPAAARRLSHVGPVKTHSCIATGVIVRPLEPSENTHQPASQWRRKRRQGRKRHPGSRRWRQQQQSLNSHGSRCERLLAASTSGGAGGFPTAGVKQSARLLVANGTRQHTHARATITHSSSPPNNPLPLLPPTSRPPTEPVCMESGHLTVTEQFEASLKHTTGTFIHFLLLLLLFLLERHEAFFSVSTRPLTAIQLPPTSLCVCVCKLRT